MKKIETQWALGNFSVKLESQVSEEQESKLLALGLRFLGQRVSAVDKAMGGFEKGPDGKLKRKPGFKRGDVAFSEALAEELKACFGTLTLPEGGELIATVTVGEYIPAEGSAPKFREEREIVGRHESAGDLDEWIVKVVGFEGETHTEDGEDFSPVMLAAVKRWKVEMLKKM